MSSANLNEPTLLKQKDLVRTPTSTFIPFSAFKIDGVGQGSMDDLRFRPNASFHAVQDITLSTEGCMITYEKALKPLERNLKESEIIKLIQDTRMGQRDRAVGQEFYIYPGTESFALSVDTQRVHIVLRNIRPLHRYQNHNTSQLSVEAFLQLIEQRCPSARRKLQGHRHEIVTLAGLESLLTGVTAWQKFKNFTKWSIQLILLLLILSIPTSIWGPENIRDPLQKIYKTYWNQLNTQLEIQKQKLISVPSLDFTLSITTNMTIDETNQKDFERYLQQKLESVLDTHPFIIKAPIQNHDQNDVVWEIKIQKYRGSAHQLIEVFRGNFHHKWGLSPKRTHININTHLEASPLQLNNPSAK